MRAGVYVDGFNLYYGARAMCGRSTPGWRWLDIKKLSQHLISIAAPWPGAAVQRVVYCTARISGASNAQGHREQDVYLRALTASASIDELAMGNYVTRTATAPLATAGKGNRPIISRPSWPVMVQDGSGADVANALFMVSVARREEKGTDVNVASHLLIEVLTSKVDAAIVVSNDSDLSFPIRYARSFVPVGVVNPTKGYTAGQLSGDPAGGVGGHWWYQLTEADLKANQLPAKIGKKIMKPAAW